MYTLFQSHKKTFFAVLFLVLYGASVSFATTPTAQTLNPDCLPTDPSCIATVSGTSVWGSITGTLANQSDLQASLATKQNNLTTGTSAQYFKGDLTLATFPTTLSSFANDANYITVAGAPVQNVFGRSGNVVATNGDYNTDQVTQGVINKYYSTTLFTADLATKTTANISEGSNLYYTQARFDTAFGNKSTSNVSEGSNLYYTSGRANTDFDIRLATKTTDNLTQGATNKYFSNALAIIALTNQNVSLFTNDAGYVVNTRTISAGTGISGGGDLSTNRTLSLNINGLATKNTALMADTIPVYDSASATIKKISRSDFLQGITGAIIYQGAYDASTNTPSGISDASGLAGQEYVITGAGTRNFGSGTLTLGVGDFIIHNGSVWQLAPSSSTVSSVFSRTGAIVAANGDYTASQIPLSTFTSGAGAVSSSDSVLQAIQKINGNVGALVTGVSSVNGATGAVTLANLTATDTTLTLSGTYNGTTARTIGLNLGSANTWTGQQIFNTSGLGTTQTTTSGLALINTTPAANNAQQISPAIRWTGNGWANSLSASRTLDFFADVSPLQSSGATTYGSWNLKYAENGGSMGTIFAVNAPQTTTQRGQFIIGETDFAGTTNTPTLQIARTGSSGNSKIEFTTGSVIASIIASTTGETRLSNSGTGYYTVYSSGAETMRVQGGTVSIGTGAAGVAKLDISDTTLAGSNALSGGIVNLAQTWNTTGSPTAILLNVTNTQSGSSSKLLDLQVVGSGSLFSVAKSGATTITNTTGASNLTLTNTTNGGNSAVFNFSGTAGNNAQFGGAGLLLSQSLASTSAISMLNMTPIWNTTGTPTAILLNVTNTASNTASLLMDLQAGTTGGTSMFKVDAFGATTLGSNTITTALTVNSNSGTNLIVGNGKLQVPITIVPIAASTTTFFANVHSGVGWSFGYNNSADQTTGATMINVGGSYNTQLSSVSSNITIAPTYNVNANTTSASILRGIYYNPTITSIGAAKHTAWENTTGDMLFGTTSGLVAIGTATTSAKFSVLSTTEQLRLNYDSSNYVKYTVGSTGGLTITPSAPLAAGINWTKTDGITSILDVDTNNARVGIGTNAPAALLHVSSSVNGAAELIRFDNPFSSPSKYVSLSMNNGGGLTFTHASSATGTGFYFTGPAGNLLAIDTNANKIGIGTNQPVTTVDIHGFGTSTDGYLRVGGNGDQATTGYIELNKTNGGGIGIVAGALRFLDAGTEDAAIYSYQTDAANASGDLRFYTRTASASSTEKMRLQGNGNVGIGTTTPGYTLDVQGTSRFGGTSNYMTITSSGVLSFAGTGAFSGILSVANDSYAFRSTTYSNAGLFFDATNVGVEVMDYTNGAAMSKISAAPAGASANQKTTYFNMNGGNVGIDNSSPAKLLHVGSSSLSTTVVARFENSSGACDHTPGASSETVACSSDERLKKNITDANNALADIMQLRIRQYDFRATDQHYNYGVIAQEVLQTPLASLVHTDDDGMYKVEVIDAWRLTKALQEMDIQINAIRPENLDNTAYTKIKEFLQGIAQNATATIDFVVSKKVTTDELQTKKLCIDEVCITKEQLQQVLGTQSTPSVVVPAAPVPAIADPVVPALVPTPVAPVEVPVEQPQ